MEQIKVGDKVRITTNTSNPFEIGEILEIINIGFSTRLLETSFRARAKDGITRDIFAHEFEPFKTNRAMSHTILINGDEINGQNVLIAQSETKVQKLIRLRESYTKNCFHNMASLMQDEIKQLTNLKNI